MALKNRLFRIKGRVQHYAWGGYEFLPRLLNIPNPDHQPFAEYWLGAHPSAPAHIIAKNKPLHRYIKKHPGVLGEEAKERYNALPYLLKILDVRDMLSIQVHPNKEDAYIEFERENQAGVPLDAPERNYKDSNHKPELMVALGDFWLLHGFRTPEKLLEMIDRVPEFAFMAALFREGGYRKLYATLMQMEQSAVNHILQPLLERIQEGYAKNLIDKDDPHFWAARAAATFNQPGKIDRGIFSIYLLNLVHLKKGEAVFQDAGVLHAYLEGQNIEIMANSDNVLRGGLTTKRIDVDELMRHVLFQPTIPQLVKTRKHKATKECIYQSPAADFKLSSYTVAKDGIVVIDTLTTDILLVIEGEILLSNVGDYDSAREASYKAGDAAVMFSGGDAHIKAISEKAILYRATVPVFNPFHNEVYESFFED